MTTESKKPEILVIDDEVDIVEMVAEILEDANYSVHKATSVESAVKIVNIGINPYFSCL